jgi:hypothetical protein
MHRTQPTFLSVPGDNRLGLVVNLPPAIKGRGVNGLPPYAPVVGYDVDKYPAAPADWPRSEGTLASYFVAVRDGCGMWLDLNACRSHSHHVAAVVSIQGINPLTGRKTDKQELEKYQDDPSIEPWLRGYQNYLATTCTPSGLMWIDGFRAQDGTVRQYVFTKDESKGVAAQLIGVNRVFSIGVSFFLSKEPKPVQAERLRSMSFGSGGLISAEVPPVSKGIAWIGHGSSAVLNAYASQDSQCLDSVATYSASVSSKESRLLSAKGTRGAKGASGPHGHETRLISTSPVVPVERLEISAGAEISQQLYKDPSDLGFWQSEPFGTVVVNYAPQESIDQIIAAGVTPSSEGFLDQLDTGNL